MTTETNETVSETPASVSAPTPVIEVGWIVAGRLDEVDREAVEQARDATLEFMRERLPEFVWRMPLLLRDELVTGSRVEAVVLLDAGIVERNIRRWDFSVFVTAADLVSHYKIDAIAVISRSLEGTVISTCRIDPKATAPETADQERTIQLAGRIQVLVIHAFCHFCGLGHHDDPQNFMFDVATVNDFDRAADLSSEQVEELRDDLQQVADQRLEERQPARAQNSALFYLRAAWINREDILESLYEAHPWQFPFRLSRLTAAAISAMMILLVTAEAWDLGMSQSPAFVTLLSTVAILFTTSYTLIRQRLFVRREHRHLTEQNVVTNLSTFSIVLAGITTTYLLLFLLTFTAAKTLFTATLTTNWAASLSTAPNLTHHLTLAAFIASLGIFIGSLGASFEQQHYFRHVTFVDEEI